MFSLGIDSQNYLYLGVNDPIEKVETVEGKPVKKYYPGANIRKLDLNGTLIQTFPIPVPQANGADSQVQVFIKEILVDSRGYLYVLISTFNGKSNTYLLMLTSTGVTKQTVKIENSTRMAFGGSNQNLFVISNNGYIYEYDPELKLLNTIPLPESIKPGVPAFQVSKEGTFYIADRSRRYVHLVSYQGELIQTLSVYRNYEETRWGTTTIPDMKFDSAGNLVVNAESEIRIVNAKGKIIKGFGQPPAYNEAQPPTNALNGYLDNSRRFVIDGNGQFIVSDGHQGGKRIQIFGPNGDFRNNLNNFGSTAGRFIAPHSLAVGPQGDIYMADTENFRVQIFDEDGVFKKVFATIPRVPFNYYREAVYGIAVDKQEQVYLTDRYNFRVVVFRPDGSIKIQFTKRGVSPNAPLVPFTPGNIAVDNEGNIYVHSVTDPKSGIFVFDQFGTYKNVIANDQTHPNSELQFRITPNGYLYVARNDTFTIDVYDLRGKKIKQIALECPWGADRCKGLASNLYFDIDRNGYLYLILPGNIAYGVHAFNPQGKLARTLLYSGAVMSPTGLTLANDTELYVSDVSGHRIRVVETNPAN